nr:hypothetical protein [Micromonospora sp. DSM 115978]
LEGQASFAVTLFPATTRSGSGSSMLRSGTSGGGHPALADYLLVCEYEGYLHFGIGLDDVVGFRVFELTDPARLVLDFAA